MFAPYLSVPINRFNVGYGWVVVHIAEHKIRQRTGYSVQRLYWRLSASLHVDWSAHRQWLSLTLPTPVPSSIVAATAVVTVAVAVTAVVAVTVTVTVTVAVTAVVTVTVTVTVTVVLTVLTDSLIC